MIFLKLYMDDASPGVRAVKMLVHILGLEIEEIHVDLAKHEHLSPAYLERNPAHTIPSLDDDGFIVNDSHVINTYLVGKYGKNDKLYPVDIKKRALVDYFLFFDNSVLFSCLYKIAVDIYFGKSEFPSEENLKATKDAYGILEKLLKGRTFCTGEEVTLGDLSVIASLSSLNFLVPVDGNLYPNIRNYLEKMQEQEFYKVNEKGLEKHIGYLSAYRKIHFHK